MPLGRIAQIGGQPALGLVEPPSLAFGIVGHLVALELADAEITRIAMGEIEAGNGRRRGHRETFGQCHASSRPDIEQIEQNALFRMVGARRIARRRTNAAIGLRDQRLVVERFIGVVGPELLAQPFVKNPDQTVGELITEISAKTGEKIEVARFMRFKVGE